MAYNNVISRTDSQALVPEQVSNELLVGVSTESAALTMFKKIPMSTSQTRTPVLSALPTAYFVNGDTGLKQTTEMNWANKYLDVQEIAAIVPIPEAVLDDTSFDVWGAIRPSLEQAIGRTLDAAVLFGVNKPSIWPLDIVHGAAAASPAVTETRGTSTKADGGIAQDFNLLFGKIETGGFTPNGVIARTSFKQVVRGARDTLGQPLADLANGTFWGERLKFVQSGLWPTPATGAAEAIAGDFEQAVIGTRQDFTYKILDQAVITDNTGAIIYNLAQQDMVAMRIVFRCAFQVANPINYEQTVEADRYPFGVLIQP